MTGPSGKGEAVKAVESGVRGSTLGDAISPLERRLVNGLDCTVAGELTRLLGEGLGELLSPSNWPGAEASTFHHDPLVKGEDFVAYLRNLANAGFGDPAAMKPVLALAAFLDRQASLTDEAYPGLLFFDPSGFRVSDDGRIIVSRLYLVFLSLDAQMRRVTPSQRGAYLHPALESGTPARNSNPLARVLYGWSVFLCRALLDVEPAARLDMHNALLKYRLKNPAVSPLVPALMMDILSLPLEQKPSQTCQQILVQLIEFHRTSPFRLRDARTMDVKHDWCQFMAQGRNKCNPVNEDRSGSLTSATMSATLAYVADGVSTADLGSGDQAAQAVADAFRDQQKAFHELVKSVSEREATDNTWMESAAELLSRSTSQAAAAIAARLNVLASQNEGTALAEHTMASTLTAALVVGDQALIYSLGDSPALLYQRSLKRLLKLTLEHNVETDHLVNREGAQFLVKAKDQSLTRFVGAVWTDNGCYQARKDTPLLLKIQLSPGDVLVLASDGLIDGIDAFDESAALKSLEVAVCAGLVGNADARVLAQRIVDLADGQRSNDNITANVLVISENGQEARKNV